MMLQTKAGVPMDAKILSNYFRTLINHFFKMPTKKTLNDQTWAEIRQVSDAGKGAEYWKVGDCKGITINGTVGTLAVNTTLYSYILGFNHNSAKEGAGIQFGTFKSALNNGVDVCLIDGSYNGYNVSAI